MKGKILSIYLGNLYFATLEQTNESNLKSFHRADE